MATITEDYVSFEVAKLLKEKGFNIQCRAAYTNYGKLFTTQIQQYVTNVLCSKGTLWDCTAPTLQTAMRWLREVHKISIEITSKGYLIDNDVEWECDIKARHRLYFRHITGEKSPESCANKAIKYCLENLI